MSNTDKVNEFLIFDEKLTQSYQNNGLILAVAKDRYDNYEFIVLGHSHLKLLQNPREQMLKNTEKEIKKFEELLEVKVKNNEMPAYEAVKHLNTFKTKF